MIPFKTIRDERTGETVVEIAVTGQMLLDNSLLNKGSGFTEEERREVATSWRKRVCEWCGEKFMWQKKKHVPAPAFCAVATRYCG